MPIFIYKAATKNGQVVTNRVEEINRFILLRRLKNNDLLPISVTQINARGSRTLKKQKRNVESSSSILKNIRSKEIEKSMMSRKERIKKALFSNVTSSKITNKDLVIFTQDFYLLKKANFNNIHALSTIIESTENPSLKGILEDILLGVEAGENMYTTMEYYEGVFPPIYINMIKVGELSGSLTRALEQAVKYLDDTMELNRKIKSVLVPNLTMFLGLIVLLIGGTIIAVPSLQGVLESVGSKDQLPAMTLWFADFLDRAVAHWYIPLIVILGIASAIFFYVRTPQGKYNFHYFKYRMPVFGRLIYAIDFTRLIRAILLNIQNGMRLQDALETSKNISTNLVMMSLIESAINNILIGQSWIEPFEKAGFSAPMATEMLKIGMQTDLAEMMQKLLDYMEIEIDESMKRIMKVLPQIIYVIVGLMLIFVTIVVLVPLIQMYMGTWLFSAYL
ncbi:MAG: type II secretion system F family protein [Clostridia bacterium]|jgi:type II secretory pathway component PulF|nr:type II secretion system F family protein [Clostridia bacterium]